MGFVRDRFNVESLGERRIPASIHNVEHRFARSTVGTENILGQRARAGPGYSQYRPYYARSDARHYG